MISCTLATSGWNKETCNLICSIGIINSVQDIALHMSKRRCSNKISWLQHVYFVTVKWSSCLKYFVIIVTYRCLRKSVELLYFIVRQLLTDSCLEESMKMLIPYGAHRYRGKSSDGNADLFKNVRWFGKFRVFRNEIRTISPVRPFPSPVTTGWLLNGRSHENGKRTKTKIEQLCFSSELNTHWLKITKCNFQTIIPCDTSFRTRSQFNRRKYLYLEIRS